MGRRPNPLKKKASVSLEPKKSQALTLDVAEPWKKRLQETIIIRKTNARRVSMAAGLNPTTVNTLLKSQRSPGIDTIMAICEALDIDLQWLMTGKEVRTVGAGTSGDAQNAALQKVPVLAWASVLTWVDHSGDAQIMRYEVAERISPPTGRFRLEMNGTSMAPLLDDGTILDCSAAASPEPEDVVIAYLARTKQCVARRLIPRAYGDDGRMLSATLATPNAAWPPIPFEAAHGDRIVAVVFDAIRPLRKMSRLTIR